MQFSERWLRTFVDPPLSTAELAERLTMAGLEVEDVAPVAPPFSGVVVARIDAVSPHPSADRLRVCTVDAGSGAPLTIVCGAPNAAAGMTVACALEGAKLPGDTVIRRASVRGVESRGMLCSAKELGLSDDASGLVELSRELVPGTGLREALALDDALITLKLTPNRADCLSLAGIAREVAAITGAKLQLPAIPVTPVASALSRAVRVTDPRACPRFSSRTIEGIDARAPTPAWMRERLERSGLRSISAVVDITNYVMLELGQPLHAYDERRLDGAIAVRFARSGEKLTLLNGDTLDLEPDLLMVCDEGKPLGLAGIMGGEHSGIDDDTSTVFLEGAYWNPLVVQGKMRRLGFTSDAGYRFERGVDFELGPRAVERATQLILAICGGKAGPLTQVDGELPVREPVRVRSARVARLLGIPIAPQDIARAFARLGFVFQRDGDDHIVTPPSFRFDLALEEDFVEEVARIHGYDAIPAETAPHRQHMLAQPETRRSVHTVKRLMAARGWQEIVTFGFVSSAIERALAGPDAHAPVAVLNPIAAHLDAMRSSLLPGLIATLQSNLARREPRVRIFESGRVFRRDIQGGYDQPLRFGGLAYGDTAGEQWGTAPRPVDMFDVKSDVEALVHPRRVTTKRLEHPALHPGRAAQVEIDGVPAGWIGELHPRLARSFELPRSPVVFELDLEPLLDRPLPRGQAVSRLPVARRDMALVVDESLPAAVVVDTLVGRAPPVVEAIRLFDVYRGPGVPPGRKSLAILVLMQDTARTLTDVEIDAVLNALVEIAQQEFGAALRA